MKIPFAEEVDADSGNVLPEELVEFAQNEKERRLIPRRRLNRQFGAHQMHELAVGGVLALYLQLKILCLKYYYKNNNNKKECFCGVSAAKAGVFVERHFGLLDLFDGADDSLFRQFYIRHN